MRVVIMTGPWQRRVRWYVRARWLGGAAAATALAFTYVAWCRPEAAWALAADLQLQQTRVAVAVTRARLDELPALRDQMSRLAARVEASGRRISQDVDPADVVRGVEAAARQAAVRKLACEPQPPRAAGDVTELPVAIALEGDFLSTFNFLKQIEDGPRLSRVRNLRIRAKPGRPGQVDVRASLTTFASADGQ